MRGINSYIRLRTYKACSYAEKKPDLSNLEKLHKLYQKNLWLALRRWWADAT